MGKTEKVFPFLYTYVVLKTMSKNFLYYTTVNMESQEGTEYAEYFI